MEHRKHITYLKNETFYFFATFVEDPLCKHPSHYRTHQALSKPGNHIRIRKPHLFYQTTF